jgi:transposase IS66-like protein
VSGCRLLTYLRDVLGRVADYPINRIAELLPWNVAVGFAPGDEIAFLFLVFFHSAYPCRMQKPIILPYVPRAQFEPMAALGMHDYPSAVWQDLCCADGHVAQGDAEEGWPICLYCPAQESGEGCGLGDVEILCSADTDQAAQRG